jgi:hypothetical protein
MPGIGLLHVRVPWRPSQPGLIFASCISPTRTFIRIISAPKCDAADDALRLDHPGSYTYAYRNLDSLRRLTNRADICLLTTVYLQQDDLIVVQKPF